MFGALLLSLIAVFSAISNAHICMWSPPQRQTVFQGTPGEHICYLKVGPCGNVPSSNPLATLTGGQGFHVMFQQNLNHYYLQSPGKLVADFAQTADPVEADFAELGVIRDYNAMNEITQTNFTLNVMIPNIDCDHCVLRMRYLSNNPSEDDRGMIFYQCADVRVAKSQVVDKPPAVAVVPKAAPAKTTASQECCAPSQFTMQGYETGSWRNPTQKFYYFDSKSQLFRVDTYSGSGLTERDGSFQMYNNFTSGIEYYYNVAADSCDLYGLNYWSDWCYGSVNNQDYIGSINVGNEAASVWTAADKQFYWTSAETGCTPISQNRGDSGETTTYYNFKAGVPDRSVFSMPLACQRAEAAFRAQGNTKFNPAPAHHSLLKL